MTRSQPGHEATEHDRECIHDAVDRPVTMHHGWRNDREYRCRRGDYVMGGPDVVHARCAIEDSTMLTVRWTPAEN